MRKLFLTVCAMVCTLTMGFTTVANAAEVTDEQVAGVKARNEAVRNVIDTKGINEFALVDMNGDGVEELVYNNDSTIDGLHGVLVWDGEEFVGACPGYESLVNMQYCKDTGCVTTVSEDGDVSTLRLLQWDEYGNLVEVELKQGHTSVCTDAQGNMYWDFVAEENKLTVEEADEVESAYSEKLPTVESFTVTYEPTTENLDKVTPVDEDAIRESLGDTDKDDTTGGTTDDTTTGGTTDDTTTGGTTGGTTDDTTTGGTTGGTTDDTTTGGTTGGTTDDTTTGGTTDDTTTGGTTDDTTDGTDKDDTVDKDTTNKDENKAPKTGDGSKDIYFGLLGLSAACIAVIVNKKRVSL